MLLTEYNEAELLELVHLEGKRIGEKCGEKRGEKRGLEKGIVLGTIGAMRDAGDADLLILEKLCRKFHLTEQKAASYMKLYEEQFCRRK